MSRHNRRQRRHEAGNGPILSSKGTRGRVPAAMSPPPMVDGTLPEGYGRTRITLLPIDPYLMHVYWEVAERDKRLFTRLAEGGSRPLHAVLRFHDVTGLPAGGSHAAGSFDVEIEIESKNWYVRLLNPEKSYIVDLGLRGRQGGFHRIVRSNEAGTPRAWPCQEDSAEFMRVTWSEGDLRLDPLPRGPALRGPVPLSTHQGTGPRTEIPGECRRAVVGIARVDVATSSPDLSAEVKSARARMEATGTGVSEMKTSVRDRQTKTGPEQEDGPIDAVKILRARLEKIYGHRRQGEPLRAGEGEGVRTTAVTTAGAGGAALPEQRGFRMCGNDGEVDLSAWCEHLFVAGLSSAVTVGVEKTDFEG